MNRPWSCRIASGKMVRSGSTLMRARLGSAASWPRPAEDCTFTGDDRSSVSVGTDDVDWIPKVSARDWIVVGRDKKIWKRPAERAALVDHPHRKLVLTAAGQLSVWEQLRVLVAQWDRIEDLSQEPPPWMYAVTKRGVRPIGYPE